MKRLTKKIKEESNKLLKMKRWEVMDKDYAVAWHPLTGLTVDKWEEEIIKYCEDRNRPYFLERIIGICLSVSLIICPSQSGKRK